MNRETVIAIIDHLPTAVIYPICTIGFVISLLVGNEQAASTLGALLTGAGIIQGKSAIASTLKKGPSE